MTSMCTQRDTSRAWLDQMVMHASLDLVDEMKWQQAQPYLKVCPISIYAMSASLAPHALRPQT